MSKFSILLMKFNIIEISNIYIQINSIILAPWEIVYHKFNMYYISNIIYMKYIMIPIII